VTRWKPAQREVSVTNDQMPDNLVIAVDMANGVEVQKHRVPPTDIVYSVDMPILPLPTMDTSPDPLHNAQQAVLW
jgi:hypothetical protein